MQFEEGRSFYMGMVGSVLQLVEAKDVRLPFFELACFDA